MDATAAPDIDLAYLSDPTDLDLLAEGLLLADEVTQGRSVLDLTDGSRLGPARDVIAREDTARAWIRSSTMTYHHPVGTCAMGADPHAGAVVGPDASVHGVDGLFVVDASVMPDLPSANTNIPTIMVAEHVAARRADHWADA